MMSESAHKSGTDQAFTSVQAYTLAVITLAIGIAVGYFARGSAASASSGASQAASASAGMGQNSIASAQLPGIGAIQQPQGPRLRT
jgi:hypothetical protein